MQSSKIEDLIKKIAKLPGFGTRSARRAVLNLIGEKKKFNTLITSMRDVYDNVKTCKICGNFDLTDPCAICQNPKRDKSTLCIVNSVSDLWAFEKAEIFKGTYHVLGGLLSVIDNTTPEDLNLNNIKERIQTEDIREVVLALPLTIEGKTTSFYISDMIKPQGVKITELAHGVPIGGELEYLDEGTIEEALKSRKEI
jgi:recombination protein RecR